MNPNKKHPLLTSATAHVEDRLLQALVHRWRDIWRVRCCIDDKS